MAEQTLEEVERQRLEDKVGGDSHFAFKKHREAGPDYRAQPHPVRENCSCLKCSSARDFAPVIETTTVPRRGRPPKNQDNNPQEAE